MWFYMILMNFWGFFKIWWILWLIVHFLWWLICFARGVFNGIVLFYWVFQNFSSLAWTRLVFGSLFSSLILMCIIGVSVFVDFFIKICIIFVFFWCLSCFCLWLVLLAQVVRFIVVFCFVVMFVFYDSVIKWLIFLLAISTISINDFLFCNFYDIFYNFFVFYNKKTPNFFGANLFYGVFHFDMLYSIFIEWFGSCYES